MATSGRDHRKSAGESKLEKQGEFVEVKLLIPRYVYDVAFAIGRGEGGIKVPVVLRSVLMAWAQRKLNTLSVLARLGRRKASPRDQGEDSGTYGEQRASGEEFNVTPDWALTEPGISLPDDDE